MACAPHLGEFTHRPNSKLDYAIDWSAWLIDGETVLTSTWTCDGALTISDDVITDGKRTTAYVAGGVLGSIYYVTNTIETATLRESRTLKLTCAR